MATRKTNKNDVDTQVSLNEETCVINVEPLQDSDEIEVVSIIPNVTYKDNKTGDIYTWEKSGNIEIITVDVLKNIYRNHRGYFINGVIKPLDERVIKLFRLEKMYLDYDFVTNKDNYTKENLDKILQIITKASNGLKYTICDFVKNMILNGDIQSVFVIKKLEKMLDVDLISFLDEK